MTRGHHLSVAMWQDHGVAARALAMREDNSHLLAYMEDGSDYDDESCNDLWSEVRSCGLPLPRCVRQREFPPMTSQTYHLILKELGRLDEGDSGSEIGEIGNCDDGDYTDAERMLRMDFLRNKVVWVGSYCEDLWYFLINMHPLISLFYSHPLHPITRSERIFVYILSFFAVTLITTYAASSDYCGKCRLPEASWCVPIELGCLEDHVGHILPILQTLYSPEQLREQEEQFWNGFCCRSEQMLARWFAEKFVIGNWNAGPMLYALVCNSIFSILCFQCMICGCVQSQSRKQRVLGQALGYVLFALVALFVLHDAGGIFLFCLEFGTLQASVTNFIEAKLLSWTGVTFVNIVTFTLLFWTQRQREDEESLTEIDPRDTEEDSRSCLAKALNPRCNVLAEEYNAFVARFGEDDKG